MTRQVLVVTGAQTQQKAELAVSATQYLIKHGLSVTMEAAQLQDFLAQDFDAKTQIVEFTGQSVELAIVLGGDGSILRAAELLREQSAPILGINAGHVGFMAEAEASSLFDALDAVVAGNYEVKNRLALEVQVTEAGKQVFSSWALNEVTVEKSARERMLEVVVEVDSRPVSSFGCDGVLVSTPTGSTAYAFSAGGPVVWPNVDAMLMIPLSAHALFARPMVVGTKTELAIEVLRRSSGTGVLWCDGRRTFDLGPGARVEVRQSTKAVPMVALSNEPFADRLVKKFSLPVTGWRGPDSAK